MATRGAIRVQPSASMSIAACCGRLRLLGALCGVLPELRLEVCSVGWIACMCGGFALQMSMTVGRAGAQVRWGRCLGEQLKIGDWLRLRTYVCA